MSLENFLSVFIFFLCMGWENGSPATANVSSLKLDNL